MDAFTCKASEVSEAGINDFVAILATCSAIRTTLNGVKITINTERKEVLEAANRAFQNIKVTKQDVYDTYLADKKANKFAWHAAIFTHEADYEKIEADWKAADSVYETKLAKVDAMRDTLRKFLCEAIATYNTLDEDETLLTAIYKTDETLHKAFHKVEESISII